MTWFRSRKKSVIIDHVTGERHELGKKPRIRKNRKECLGGCRASGIPRLHDSGEEAQYCNKLRILRKVGEIADYETQKIFYLKDSKGNSCGYHKVDFVVRYKDGREVLQEYKGFRTREWELKVALLSWNYPEVVYEVKTYRDLI